MTRRLLLAAAVAVAALASPAGALTDPPCYGAFAGEAVVGYCAGIVCDDLCYPRAYAMCTLPDAPAVCVALAVLPSV